MFGYSARLLLQHSLRISSTEIRTFFQPPKDDFARLMDGAKEIKCSEFGDAIIHWMDKTPPAPKAVVPAAKASVKKVVVKKATAKKAVAKKVVKKTAPKKTAAKKATKKVVAKKPVKKAGKKK